METTFSTDKNGKNKNKKRIHVHTNVNLHMNLMIRYQGCCNKQREFRFHLCLRRERESFKQTNDDTHSTISSIKSYEPKFCISFLFVVPFFFVLPTIHLSSQKLHKTLDYLYLSLSLKLQIERDRESVWEQSGVVYVTVSSQMMNIGD